MSNGFVTGPLAPPPKPPSAQLFLTVGLGTLLLLLVLGLWLAQERTNADGARAVLRDSYSRRLSTSELLARLNQAESAQRGYVISGDAAFLLPYYPARRGLLRQLPAFVASYRDQPSQAARIAELRRVVEAKLAEMDRVIRARRMDGMARAVAIVSGSRGRMLMERARSLTMAVLATEDAVLAGQLAQLNGAIGKSRMLIWLTLAFGAIAWLLIVVQGWRTRQVRFRTEMAAREILVRLRGVFASSTDAIIILNPSGTIEDINPAATAMFGFTSAELERRDISRLLRLADGEASFEERMGIVDGRIVQPIRVDQVARHRDGRELTVDVALGLMPLADGVHVVASLRDVSERKAAELLKDQFISTVSHELRTPLTSVLGSLGLLRGGAAGALSTKAERLVDIADNNARRLIRLINDILDIDRMASGQARLEQAVVDLKDVVARAMDDTRGLGTSKDVRLELRAPAEPLPILGDTERLLQVIGNLLSNAIRFSPVGGVVTLELTRDQRRVNLCVIDQGPGVPPDFRTRLFERFAQSGAGAAIPGGSGLGLTISREIVRAHGGEIWFEDAPGGGAHFCLWLALQSRGTPRLPGDQQRVLVCEDDHDAAQVLRLMIEAEGLAVDMCGSAREAQSMAANGNYAGVILDLRLPDANGLSVIRGLRAAPETRLVPIIVVSGVADDGARDPAACTLDVVDWIDKPVSSERLLAALDVALCRSSDGKPTLLHIDDDPDMLEVTAMGLAGRARMLRAESLAQARAILRQTVPDVVILDLNLSDGSGLELLPELVAPDGSAVPTIIYSASELAPEVGRQVDAVLIKSRRSLRALSGKIGEILDQRRPNRKESA
ncbi:response regulator [Sphingomonas solaris]|uniref:histidine kinase n=1 Tax=Alterirhizorhabdus solaris TaxID=2529389 RepID=A0A558R336_9SPHN|nr:response regulator [Sphingomonas solaris]TVV73791.1 response regulator [Sphingomonas solaris]